MSKKFLPLYISAKIIKIDQDFPKLWSQMYCHLFYGSQCICILEDNVYGMIAACVIYSPFHTVMSGRHIHVIETHGRLAV